MTSVALTLALLSTIPSICGGPPLQELSEGEPRVALAAVEMLEDATGELSFEEVSAPELCSRFEPSGDRLQREIASRSTYWLRFRLSAPEQAWLLRLSFTRFDRLCVHWPTGNDQYSMDCSGLEIPAAKRSIVHHFTYFPLPSDLDPERPAYLQAESASRFYFRPEIILTTEQLSSDHIGQIQAGFYHGLLLTTALFGLMFAVGMRDKASLFFAAHIVCFSLAMMAFAGRTWELLWPWLDRGSHYPPTLLLASSALFGALYGREYLHTREHSPLCDLFLLGAAIFSLSVLPATFLTLVHAEKWTAASFLLSMLGLAIAGTVRTLQGDRSARYLLVALSGAIVGALAKSLEVLGVIVLPFDGARITRIGIAVGAIIMTLGLTRRLERLRRERDRASEEAAALQEIALFRAYRDDTTGLPNRAKLSTEIETELTRSVISGGSVAVLVLDIDRFRASTETLSQRDVDTLIQDIAERLRNTAVESGLIARLAQDRFGTVVLFEGSRDEAESGARKLASALLENVVRSVEIGGQSLPLQATVGVAFSPRDGQTADELLRSCSAAVYHARANGTGPIEFFSTAERFDSAFRLSLKTELPRALEVGELEVHYQPQLDLATGEILGAEALVRWNHPECGLLQPGDFIGIAEETKLITEIDQWVLRAACRDLARLQDLGLHLPKIAVNFSAQGFRLTDFVDRVNAVLAEEGTQPHRIELELTESLLVADPIAAENAIGDLRSHGFRTCIDDFGTGYSSLSYIRDFRVGGLKIDRSFISRVGESAETEAIVGTIVELGRDLGLTVIAEGIEQPEQVRILRAHHCEAGQGYLWAKPLPFAEFVSYMKRGGGIEPS